MNIKNLPIVHVLYFLFSLLPVYIVAVAEVLFNLKGFPSKMEKINWRFALQLCKKYSIGFENCELLYVPG
jgi:hypothetical protein